MDNISVENSVVMSVGCLAEMMDQKSAGNSVVMLAGNSVAMLVGSLVEMMDQRSAGKSAVVTAEQMGA